MDLIFSGLRCSFFLIIFLISSQIIGQDVRGFMVEIDHDQSFISIQALFYSKNNTNEEHTQIAKGIDFWNLHSDKYMYRLPDGKCYSVIFDLRYPEGTYNQQGVFLPSLSENHALLNQVEILPDSLLNHRNHDPNRIIAGYSPNNFVYVGKSYYDLESVWIHEIGHRIGASHRHGHGIMAETISWGKRKVAAGTVKELLTHAGISFPSMNVFFTEDKHDEHEIQPAKILHRGMMPENFFTAGKLKKQSKRRQKCQNLPVQFAANSLK